MPWVTENSISLLSIVKKFKLPSLEYENKNLVIYHSLKGPLKTQFAHRYLTVYLDNRAAPSIL
jgi:hypothetical protein